MNKLYLITCSFFAKKERYEVPPEDIDHRINEFILQTKTTADVAKRFLQVKNR